MTPIELRVSDGIQLSCIQTEKFKSNILTLTVCLPASKEQAALRAVLPGVLRRGTQRYPDMASIHRRLDELYASCIELTNSRIGRMPIFTATAEFLSDSYVTEGGSVFDGVLDMLAEMLLHPRMENGCFPASDVQQEIGFSQDAVRSEINNTRAYAAIRCLELMNRNDADFPTLNDLAQQLPTLSAQQITDYYRQYVLTAPLHAFYVGNLPPETVANRLQAAFAEWHVQRSDSLLLPTVAVGADFLSQTEQMPVAQGKLTMGFRTDCCDNGSDHRVYTALVFNELFGGAASSKLFLNVREKMSLCYYCSSSYHRYTGIVTVSAGIDSKNRAVTEAAVLEQLASIERGEITQSELDAAKRSLQNAYRQIDDNPFELQAFYGTRGLLGLRASVEESRRQLDAVGVEEIAALARQCRPETVFFVEGTKADAACEEEPND